MVISKKTIIFQCFRGVQHFFRGGGGSNFFRGGGGPNAHFYRTCDFPGGGSGPPIPSLDPHMFERNIESLSTQRIVVSL